MTVAAAEAVPALTGADVAGAGAGAARATPARPLGSEHHRRVREQANRQRARERQQQPAKPFGADTRAPTGLPPLNPPRPEGPPGPGPGPGQQPRSRQRETSRKRGPSVAKPKLNLAGKVSGGVLLSEYVVGVLLIASSMLTKGPAKGYLVTSSQILLRLTALTAIFFVLFLVAGSPKAGKAAAWFGLLVDLGILFTAVTESQVTTLQDIIQGNPTGIDQATLTASTSLTEPTPVQLPS